MRFAIALSGSRSAKYYQQAFDFIGEPAGTRTQDPVIKSHVLYRLSYGLAKAPTAIPETG